MARSFSAASSQYLYIDSVPFNDGPLTWSCWFQVNDTNTPYQFVGFDRMNLSGDSPYGLQFRPDYGANTYGLHVHYAEYKFPVTYTTTANTWMHYAVTYNASTLMHTGYVNGTLLGTLNTGVNPYWDRIIIGARGYFGELGLFLNGKVAEVAVWRVDLTADEIASLYRGYSPLLIRPGSLRGYWPLTGRHSPEPDLREQRSLTLSGSPGFADHPKVIYPTRPQLVLPAAGGGGGGGGKAPPPRRAIDRHLPLLAS